MYASAPVLGTWDIGGRPTSVAGATVITMGMVPPFMGGPGRSRRLWNFASAGGISQAVLNSGITHVEKCVVLTLATAQQFGFFRPLNFTFVKSNSTVASSHTRLTLPNDPAYWSATWPANNEAGAPVGTGTYMYDQNLTAGTVVATTAAVWPPTAQVKTTSTTALDWIVTQLADGTWIADTVLTSWTTTFTTGMPTTAGAGTVDLTSNFPAGSILAGAPFYWFGPITQASSAFASQLLDPATGTLPPTFNFAASSGPTLLDLSPYASSAYGICSTLHPGDPLLFGLSQVTNAAIIETLCGWYSKW